MSRMNGKKTHRHTTCQKKIDEGNSIERVWHSASREPSDTLPGSQPCTQTRSIYHILSRWGEGGALPDFFFFLFFSCSADHERDWSPCKIVFLGLATNALNVSNNNSNNSDQRLLLIPLGNPVKYHVVALYL